MSVEDIIKQITILKMKQNHKHDNEAFNLINFSFWDLEAEDPNKLNLLDDLSKVHFKLLRSLK